MIINIMPTCARTRAPGPGARRAAPAGWVGDGAIIRYEEFGTELDLIFTSRKKAEAQKSEGRGRVGRNVERERKQGQGNGRPSS